MGLEDNVLHSCWKIKQKKTYFVFYPFLLFVFRNSAVDLLKPVEFGLQGHSLSFVLYTETQSTHNIMSGN